VITATIVEMIHIGNVESAAGNHGYVLVNPPNEIERRVHARSRDQQLSSTLVYSGQGSVVRNVAPSYRGGMLICEAPAMHHVISVDLYQALIQELHGRLGMVNREEVDATSLDSTAPIEGHNEQNWDEPGSVQNASFGRMSVPGNEALPEPNTAVKAFSAMLLSELISTLSSGTKAAESIDEAVIFSGLNSED
jgi:hypothetical protein